MLSNKKQIIQIKSTDEVKVLEALEKRNDPDALRLKRFLAMPDLSRQKGSPIAELAECIIALPRFRDFEVLNVPEIVGYGLSFDLFNFPFDHPARSRSDTYFVDDNNILRTHTTVMWYYHLNLPEVKEKIKTHQSVGALSHGRVYRKDEIDRFHLPVFHQIDGWYLCPKENHVVTIQDLQNVLIEIAKAIFGESVKYRFNIDQFPYTDPSVEMEIEVKGKWMEVLGCGIVRGGVLKNFGVDPDEYNGWAGTAGYG